MDFFAAQELRRSQTRSLVLMYGVAIVLMILTIWSVIEGILFFQAQESGQPPRLHLDMLAYVAAGNLAVILGASVYRIVELRGGGEQVAVQLGGRRVHPTTSDRLEKRLVNVVEEMALASGISVPPVYILDDEPGINAFAAGYSPADAVIGVNRGTVEQLTRDELQGVIAHEFSHVLNGDMRLNIRLIGILFGIQAITMIGYFLMRTMSHGSGRRRSRDSDGDKGKAGLLVFAIVLMVVGYVGHFFARWIKASISRKREYLADASAVQFTRNPQGIGGALKTIGSHKSGSRIQSPNADEVSHLFFASGLRSAMSGLFATHPPLVPRIQMIDPQFEGDFSGWEKQRRLKEITAAKKEAKDESLNRATAADAIPNGMFPPGVMEKFRIDPAVLLATIGSPGKPDMRRSRMLLKQIPGKIITAAEDPWSARGVVFATLLSDDPANRQQQLALIQEREKPATRQLTELLLPTISGLELIYRLPVMELLQGTLSSLSQRQYQTFRKTVTDLVSADNRTSLFELIVRHHLLMHLDRRFNLVRPPTIVFRSIAPLREETQLLLSAFATVGAHSDEQVTREGYRLAMQTAGLDTASADTSESDSDQAKSRLPETFVSMKALDIDRLEGCLHNFHRAAPAVKEKLLRAAATLILFDHDITVAEAEFFRAVAESLDCPVPAFAAGTILAGESLAGSNDGEHPQLQRE